MPDRHVRGVTKVVGELSNPAKSEFCKRAHTESVELAKDAMTELRTGNFEDAWRLVNEGRAIGQIMGISCSRVRFKL